MKKRVLKNIWESREKRKNENGEPVFDWVWEPCGDYVRVEMTVEGERCEGAIRIKGKAEK